MYQCQFLKWKCDVHIEQYQTNGNTALVLTDAEDGSPIATASVNTGEKLSPRFVAIKDYSENEGMLDALMEAKIISAPHWYINLSFDAVPVCELLIS